MRPDALPPRGGWRRVSLAGRRLNVGIAAGVALTLVGAGLLAAPARRGPDAAAPPPDGLVRVDAVRALPVAAVQGPVLGPAAAGTRQVSILFTLAAGERELRYAAGQFTLTVDRQRLSPFRVDLPGSLLRPGSTLAGEAVFDVPENARTAVLARSGRTVATLRLPPASADR